MSSKKQISIEIVSDILCPWCIIGYVKLKEAMDNVKDQYDFKVHFSPYLLKPNIAKDGIYFREYLEEKGMKYNPESAKQMLSRIQQAGLQNKYPVIFAEHNEDKKMYNTINGHRLAEWCLQKYGSDKQIELYEHIIRKFHEERKNIHEPQILADYAQQLGYDRDQVKDFIINDTQEPSQQTILKKAQSASYNGVSGVPFFIFNGKYSFSGAQDPQTFIQVFGQVAQKEKL